MRITIISGSDHDAELVKKVEGILKDFGVEYEAHVASAHRNPKKIEEIVKSSRAEVFIGVAGLSAALPGVIASHTTRPVIGLPREVRLGGLDALLSMAQMPPGVPVATVGIENGWNAALLAIEILALRDESLRKKLEEYRERQRK